MKKVRIRSPRSEPGISFLPAAVGRRQRSNEKYFVRNTRASCGVFAFEALLSDRLNERGAWGVIGRVIQNEVSVESALPCAPDSLAPLLLHPPSDEYPGVVASVARAVCACRAWFRGSPRQETRAQSTSSSATHFRLERDRTARAFSVPVGHGRHFSLTRARFTVASASGSTGKQWHTR
jgi:hypothetical protein